MLGRPPSEVMNQPGSEIENFDYAR
jgi:hypothetical protein